jgi:NADH dehydrogenase FAD-containing subunit
VVWLRTLLLPGNTHRPSPIANAQVQSDKLKNYFAIGDVSTSPGWKTSQTALADAQFAAHK